MKSYAESVYARKKRGVSEIIRQMFGNSDETVKKKRILIECIRKSFRTRRLETLVYFGTDK